MPSDTSRLIIFAVVPSTSSESAIMSPKLLILSDPRARAYALSDSTISVSDLSEQWKSPYVNSTVGEERCGRCLGVGNGLLGKT